VTARSACGRRPIGKDSLGRFEPVINISPVVQGRELFSPCYKPVAWADELGRDDVVRLLTTNLNEEKAADKKLSTVALRKGVNRKAAS
jgi:hypothetical protein